MGFRVVGRFVNHKCGNGSVCGYGGDEPIVNVASTTKTSLRLYTSVRLTSYGVTSVQIAFGTCTQTLRDTICTLPSQTREQLPILSTDEWSTDYSADTGDW